MSDDRVPLTQLSQERPVIYANKSDASAQHHEESKKHSIVDKLMGKFFHTAEDKPKDNKELELNLKGEELLKHYLKENKQPELPAGEVHEREITKASVVHPSLLTPNHAQQIKVRRVLLLYNPESGAHEGVKIAEEAKELFLRADIEVHAIALEQRGHGEELTKYMDLKPYDVLCFIGGDGTFHECVNGLMKRADDQGKEIPVAMIAAGTGNSFALELLGDTNIKVAVETIKKGLHVPVDVGRVTQLEKSKDGTVEEEIIYSFNSIHWGLGSKVVLTAEKLRWMGKAVRYTTAALFEIFNGEKTKAIIRFETVDGKVTEHDDEFCVVIANNIVVAAKGMKMAPKAKLNDGLMDLIIVRSQKVMDLMSIFSHVYDGTHTKLDQVEYVQVKWFEILPFRDHKNEIPMDADPETSEEVVDIDGELKGSTPFRCEMIPLALKVIV